MQRQGKLSPAPGRTRTLVTGTLLVLMALTCLLRVWNLSTTPPRLFSDEAAYGVDAQAVLRGQFRVFFPDNLGREPLFIYLAVPFVALWNGTAIAVRLPAAILGMLMVPALFFAARALWRERPRMAVWVGLTAAALWLTNYWPQSVNRLGFHVNTLPLVLTLAVTAWLNWTHAPTRGRALSFGVLAGLATATYLAGRITPVLWPLLYLALSPSRRKALRPTLPVACLAFLLAVLPLAVHFGLHPEDLTARLDDVSDATHVTSAVQYARFLLGTGIKVLGVFLGGPGDAQLRHNLPGRAPFALWQAILFASGLLLAGLGLRRRDQPAWSLLLWFSLLTVPAVFSLDESPHFLRLLGALPAALLLVAWPVAWLVERGRDRSGYLAPALAMLLVMLVGFEGVRTARDYFITWTREPSLSAAFQADDIVVLKERLAQATGIVGVVPLDPRTLPGTREFALDYEGHDTNILQLRLNEGDIEDWLSANLGIALGSKVMLPVWHPPALADPKGVLQFYLMREASLEASEVFSGFDLLTFSLERLPQFRAAGQLESPGRQFSSRLTLTQARWGAGYPNADRSGSVAAAGTPVWAILTWRLERPSPDLKVSLDVVDAAGHRLSSNEVPLLNAQREPTSQWEVGTEGQTYHLVNVPATQLPGLVGLESRVYEAETLVPLLPDEASTPRASVRLGASISITTPQQGQTAETFHVAHPIHAAFPSGLTLLGLDPPPAEIRPGQVLTLRLFWQAATPLSYTETYTICIGSTGVHATVRLSPDWPQGQVEHTYVDLDLPAEVATGTHDLLLVSQGGGPPLLLGQVAVLGRPHQFQVPSLGAAVHARFGDAVILLGVGEGSDLSGTPGQPVMLSLVWKALRTNEQDLVRFVHLLGKGGRPLAQKDAVPCEGTCPASSWLAGEVLLDQVELRLPADLPPGSYSLAVGWYWSARPSLRLPATDAAGQALQDNVVVLPVEVAVTP